MSTTASRLAAAAAALLISVGTIELIASYALPPAPAVQLVAAHGGPPARSGPGGHDQNRPD